MKRSVEILKARGFSPENANKLAGTLANRKTETQKLVAQFKQISDAQLKAIEAQRSIIISDSQRVEKRTEQLYKGLKQDLSGFIDKITKNFGDAISQALKAALGGQNNQVQNKANCGFIRGSYKGFGIDSVPAKLQPGEFVVKRKVASNPMVASMLQGLNDERIGFANGGLVGGDTDLEKLRREAERLEKELRNKRNSDLISKNAKEFRNRQLQTQAGVDSTVKINEEDKRARLLEQNNIREQIKREEAAAKKERLEKTKSRSREILLERIRAARAGESSGLGVISGGVRNNSRTKRGDARRGVIEQRAREQRTLRTNEARRNGPLNVEDRELLTRGLVSNVDKANRISAFRNSGLPVNEFLSRQQGGHAAPANNLNRNNGQQQQLNPLNNNLNNLQGNLGQFNRDIALFNNAVQNLGNLAQISANLQRAGDQLANAVIPERIVIESAPIQLNVNLNGAEVLNNMKPELVQIVTDRIHDALQSVINPITGQVSEGINLG